MVGEDQGLNKPQPTPIANDNPAVWDLVITDILQKGPFDSATLDVANMGGARDRFGLEKYGTRLQPENGRDSLVDALQERMDCLVYERQAIWEAEKFHSGKPTRGVIEEETGYLISPVDPVDLQTLRMLYNVNLEHTIRLYQIISRRYKNRHVGVQGVPDVGAI